MRSGIAGLVALTIILPCHAQNSSVPTIRTSSRIVIVDVGVTDAHGNPVHNLKQSDFTVLENGAPQAINHFEEHTAPTPAELAKTTPPLPPEPNVYTNITLTPQSGPINILLVDMLNTPLDAQVNVRRQLVSFVQGMKPGTRLAVFALTTHLTLLQGLTSDPQLLLAAVNNKNLVQQSPTLNAPIDSETMSDRIRPFDAGVSAGLGQNEREQANDMDRSRVYDTLGAMNQLARYLSGMPGRKNLIWLSGSFPLDFSPSRHMASGSLDAKAHETTNLLANSQVAVYPIDARGLETSPTMDVSSDKYVMAPDATVSDTRRFSAQTSEDQNSMHRVAQATGGTAYLNTNDLRAAVDRAIDNGSSYYTLTYTPSDTQDDGGSRRIAVHLASGDATLTYRDGYYAIAPSPTGRPDKPATPALDAMHAAMQRGAPTPTQILFKALMVASPGQSNKPAPGNVISPKAKAPYRLITIAYVVNPGDISMPQRPDGTRQVALEFVAAVYDADGIAFTEQSNPINIFAKPEAVKDFAAQGVRYQQQIAVPVHGEYYVRAGIHDMIADTVGAIEVPAAGIATAPIQPAAGSAHPQ
jgi:VWFA-related protein